MTIFVDLKSVRYNHHRTNYYYFDDKGVLYRGKSKRVFVHGMGSAKYLTLEMQTAEKVEHGFDWQNEEIKKLILNYGLPILPSPSGWREWEKKHKNSRGARRWQ